MWLSEIERMTAQRKRQWISRNRKKALEEDISGLLQAHTAVSAGLNKSAVP